MFDYTTLISAIIATATAGGWLVSATKRRQDNETHKAEIAAKEAEITATIRESETKYTREALEIYTSQVIQPLRDEIARLRENQIRLQAAVNAAPTCRHYPDCVVIRRLQTQGATDNQDQ